MSNNWNILNFGDLIILEYGNTLTEENRSGEGYPVYGSNGIIGFHKAYLLDSPNIIVGRKGSVGEVVWANKNCWAIDTTYYVTLKQDNSLRFIYWLLKSFDLRKLDSSTGVPGLNRNDVYRIKCNLPSLPEQEKIAEILDTIAETIAKTEECIAKLKKIKTGLVHDLLTRGIDENGEIRDPVKHPEQFKQSAIGLIPKDWEIVSLSNLAEAIDPQPDHRTPPEVTDGIPYIGVSDFNQEGLIDFLNARKVSINAFKKQRQSFVIEEGDFVFGKIGTIGKPQIIPVNYQYALSANVILLKPNETHHFVYSWMNSDFVNSVIEKEIHSTSQPAFGIQKIRNIPIIKPSLWERDRISQKIFSMDELIKHNKITLEKLKLQKKGLMHDLLTGKVRVNHLL